MLNHPFWTNQGQSIILRRMDGPKVHRIPAPHESSTGIGIPRRPAMMLRIIGGVWISVVLVWVIYMVITEPMAGIPLFVFWLMIALVLTLPFYHHRKYPPRSLRLDRLKELVDHKDALRRCPHRVVEWLLWQGSRQVDKLDQKLGQLNDCIIIAQAPDVTTPIHWAPLTHGFEPISLDTERDQLLAVSEQERARADLAPSDPKGHRWRKVVVITVKVVVLSVLLSLLGSTISWIRNGFPIQDMFIPVLLLTWAPIAGVVYFEYGRTKTFIIPGGLVFRNTPLWRGSPTHLTVRCGKSCLLINHKSDTSAILRIACGEFVCEFNLSPEETAAFLAAWTSTAEPPSDEAVASFCGVAADSATATSD